MSVTPRNVKESREPSRQRGFVFSDFQERVNEVKVLYKSSTRNFTYEIMVRYWPGKFDDEMMRRIAGARTMSDAALSIDGLDPDLAEEQDSASLTNEIITTLVKEWDIWDRPEEDGGRKIPPEEIVTELEIPFKSEVIAAIQKDMRPTEQRRQRSSTS
jgi:hypothetical protein